MPLPRFRFSVRHLIVFVALSAIACGGYVMWGKAQTYRSKGRNYAKNEQAFLSLTKNRESMIGTIIERINLSNTLITTLKRKHPNTLRSSQFHHNLLINQEEFVAHEEKFLAEQKKSLADFSAMATYYSSLKDKYEYAARHPWLSVPPDPPPPSDEHRVNFWLSRGDYEQALAELDKLVERDPSPSNGYLNLQAWILATCPIARYRDGRRAIELATRACKLSDWTQPYCLDTLAAAYAESGDFAAAVHWQQDAVSRAPPNLPNRQGMADRLSLYQQEKPYREKPNAD